MVEEIHDRSFRDGIRSGNAEEGKAEKENRKGKARKKKQKRKSGKDKKEKAGRVKQEKNWSNGIREAAMEIIPMGRSGSRNVKR